MIRRVFIFFVMAILLSSVANAEVLIDNAAHDVTDMYGPPPNVVCIDDNNCYAFYLKNTAANSHVVYSKTTNGGAGWGTPTAVDDSTQYQFKSFGVWYDQWTPGDTGGNLIHIFAPSLDDDEAHYNYVDTSDDSTRGSWSDTPAWSYGNNPDGGTSITKSTDGYLFAGGFGNATGDRLDIWKSTDDGDNWTVITPTYAFLTDDQDFLELYPLSGGDILAIYWDFSTDTMYSFVYDEATDTWDGSETTVDASVGHSGPLNCNQGNSTCGNFGASLYLKTGDVYLAANNDAMGTGADLKAYKFDDGTRTWSTLTDIYTNIGVDSEDVKIGINEMNGDLYAVFIEGTSTARDINYRVSTDGGTSWSGSTQISGATQRDIRIVDMNIMSDERLIAVWYIDNLNDVYTNTVVDLSPEKVSGTVYSDEGSTALPNVTVRLAINGVDFEADDTGSDGSYTINTETLSSDDILTVYLEDETENGITVAVSDGNDFTGLDIYQNRLIVRDDNTANGTIDLVNSAIVSGDSDISDIYSVGAGVLTVNSPYELFIPTGDSFIPDNNMIVHDLDVNGTLTQGANDLTITGSFDNDGTFSTTGDMTFTSTVSETVDTGGTGVALQNVTFDGVGGTWVLDDGINIDGDLEIVNGTLDAKTAAGTTVRVAGDWSNSGTFQARDSVVILDGGNQEIWGSTAFGTLRMIETSNNGISSQLRFDENGTQTFNNVMQLQGLDSDDLIVLSGISGGTWKIDPKGTRNIKFLGVQNSDNINATVVSCTNGCVDNTGNTNWSFTSSPITISGTVYTDLGMTTMGSGRTVGVSINGGAVNATDDTDAGGAYSLTTASAVGSGAVLTLYLENEVENAVTITVADGTDISNLDLYEDHLILRSDDGNPLDSIQAVVADDNGDGDITTGFNFSGFALNVNNGWDLVMDPSVTYQSFGNVTVGTSGSSSDFYLQGTFEPQNSINTEVRGNFSVSGAFEPNGGSVTVHSEFTSLPGGNFTAPTGGVILEGDAHLAASTYTHNNITLEIDGSSAQDINLGGNSFHTIQVDNDSAAGAAFTGAFTTQNLVNTIADSSMAFQQNTTFTITDTLTLTGAASQNIKVTSTDQANRFTFSVTGGNQSVDYIDLSYSQVSSNNITANNSSNLGNTDSGEVAPHWIFPSPSQLAIQTGRFAIPPGTGTLAVTGVGFQPKGYILIISKNATDDADSPEGAGNGSMIAIGMTDGTNEFCLASGSGDDLGTTEAARRGFTDEVACNIDVEDDNQTVLGEANHSSLDPDGFTINRTVGFTEPNSLFADYIAFGGNDLSIYVGSVDLNDTQDASFDETNPGFEPDLVLTAYVGYFRDINGNGNNDDHSLSFGWAVNPDVQVNNNQFSQMTASRDARTTTITHSRFDSNYAGTSYRNGTIDASFEIENFDASGFDVTTRATAAAGFEIMIYTAINLGADPQVFTTNNTTPTSTGTQSEQNAKFEPIFLMAVGSAVNTSVDTDEVGGSFAIGMSTDGTNDFTVLLHDQNAATTSNTHSRNTNTHFLSAYAQGGGLDFEADLTSFDTSGWTLNFTDAASAAYQVAYLAIGVNPAPATITGSVYSDEGVTKVGAGVPVALSINGADAVQEAQTDSSGDYEFTLNTSASDVLTIYLDDTGINAVGVTVSDGNLVSGQDLYYNYLILRQDNGGSLTNANLATADNNGDDDITDVYSMSANQLTVNDGYELLIDGGDTYAPGDTVTCDDLDIDGTFTMGSNTITISGGFDATGGSFTSSGTVTFDAIGSETLRTGGNSFSRLRFNGVGGTWTLQDNLAATDDIDLVNGTVALGSNDVTVGASWNATGGSFTVSGDSTMFFTSSGSEVISSNGGIYNNLSFTGSGTWVLEDALDVNGSISILNGNLDVNSSENNAISFTEDWTNAGNLVARSGTITMDGTYQKIGGSTTFYNLTKQDLDDDGVQHIVEFDNTKQQNITGTWNFSGLDATDRIIIISDSTGNQWDVDPSGSRNLSFLDVEDSNNVSGTTVNCTNGCFDNNDNTDWNFLAGQIALSGTVFSDDGTTNIGAGIEVAVSINGASADSSDLTDGSGNYIINTASAVGAGAVLTFFIDDMAQNAVTVTVSDGTNASGIDLYQNYLIVRNDNNGTTTNTDLASGENGDGDVSAIYSTTGTTLNLVNNILFHVPAGNSYTPTGNVNLPGSGNVSGLDVDGSMLMTGGAYTLSVEGTVEVSGTLTGGSGSMDFDGNFILSAGEFTASSTAVSLSGTDIDFTGGSFVHNNGTVTIDGTGAQTMSFNGATFNNLTVTNPTTGTITFDEAFSTENFTDTVANSVLRFQQSVTFAIGNSLSLTGAASNEIDLDSVDGANRFVFDVAGGAQTVTYVNVKNSEVISDNITANNSTNGANNDSAEAAPHWVFAQPANMDIDVGRFTIPNGSSSTIAVTGVGFQPKAYILFLTKNAVDDANSAENTGLGGMLSIGMTDGTRQFCFASGQEDNQVSTDIGRRASTTRVLCNIDVGDAQQQWRGLANHVSMDGDGFTINVTTLFTEPTDVMVEYVAIGGADISAYVDTASLNMNVGIENDITSPNFEPDLVIGAHIGYVNDATNNSNNDDATISLGWAINPTIQSSNNQYSIMMGGRDGQTTTYARTRFDSQYAGTSWRNAGIDVSYEVSNFDSSGFSVTTRLANGAANEAMGYLALDLGTNPLVYTVNRTTPTSAGVDRDYGTGFTPIFLMGIGSAVATAVDTNTGGGSISIGISDGNDEYAISMHDENGVTNSNTHSRTTNTQFMLGYTDDGAVDWEGTISSFNNSGWSMNYTDPASAAYQTAFLAIGITESSATITGTVYQDQGVTPIGANWPVSLSVNGSGAAQTVTTDGSGNYEFQADTNAGDILTLYLDGTTEEAVAVTVTDGNLISGLDLYEDTLIIRHDNTGGTTNADLAIADDNGDSQITNFYSVSGSSVTIPSSVPLLIWADGTYQPGGSVTAHDVDIDGTFAMQANSIVISGGWDSTNGRYSGTGTTTFTSNSSESIISGVSNYFGNVNFSGATGTWALNGDLDVNGNLTISNSGTLDVSSTGNYNVYVGGNWNNSGGGYFDSHSGTVTFDGASSYTIASGDQTFNNVNFGATSGVWVLEDALDVDGHLTINGAGTLDANNSENNAINVAGDWSNNGTFAARGGTVTLDGSGQSIYGNTTFNNFTYADSLDDGSNITLTFQNSRTQTVTGTWTVQGFDADDLVSLRSDSSGDDWLVDVQGSRVMSYLDVKDSNNIAADVMNCTNGCVDSLGNTNWNFTAGAITISGTVYSSEGTGAVGAGFTVAASINGAAPDASDNTDASGNYTINTVSNVGASAILTLYLDDQPNRAVVVTASDGSDMTGVDLYHDFLILREDNGSSLSNANLDVADNNGDADITAFYSVAGGNVTVANGYEVLIPAGHAFAPGGDVNIGTSGNTTILDLDGSWIAAASETITIEGTFDSSGDFVGNTGTLDVNGNFNVSAGSFTAMTVVNLSGTDLNLASGTLTHNSSTFTLDSASNTQTFSTGGNTFNNLVIANTSGNNMTFDEVFTTANLTDNIAGSQLRFLQDATYEVTNTITINGNTTSNVDLNSIDNSNRFVLNPSGGSQTVGYVTVSNSEVISNNIVATNSSNGINNDSAETLPHWVFSDPTDLSIDVGRISLHTTTGNQVIDGLGFQPKGYILITSRNATDDEDSPGSMGGLVSIGMTDGTRQFCMGSGSLHNVGTSQVGRRGMTDEVSCIHNIENDNQDVEMEANHVSMNPDGFTINISVGGTAPPAPLVEYIAFGGGDVSVYVDMVDLANTNNTSVDENVVGFRPDIVFTSYIGRFQDASGNGANDDHSLSLGWAIDSTIQSTDSQFSMMTGSRDAQATSQAYSRFDTIRAGTALRDSNIDASFEINEFDASGFSVYTRLANAGTAEIMGYMAVDIGGTDPQIYSTSRTSITSIGDDRDANAKFQPIFLLGIGSAVATTSDTNVTGGSWSVGMSDGVDTYTVMMHDDHGVGTTDTHTRNISGEFLSAYDETGVVDYRSTLSSFDVSGWTLNYNNAASGNYLQAFLAIGTLPATPTITGRVYTDQGSTSIGANKTVSISVNGATVLESAETDTNGDYEFTLSTSAADILTVYLDDEAENAVVVTEASGNIISDLDLYQNYLIIRQDNTGAITNATLDTANNSGDTDIDAIYTLAGTALTVVGTNELLVHADATYNPGDSIVVHDIEVNGTMDMGSNSLTVSGGFDATGNGEFTSTGDTSFTSTTSEILRAENSTSFGNVDFNGAGGIWVLQSSVDFNGNLVITQGTLDANVAGDYAITVSGDWSSDGIFQARAGFVTLDGSDQSVYGTTTFYNFTKTETSDDSTNMNLTFEHGTTQTFNGSFQLNGLDANDLLVLRSTSSGAEWFIDPTGTRSLIYLDVKDSNNVNGAAAECTLGCVDNSNNTNWDFGNVAKKIFLIW